MFSLHSETQPNIYSRFILFLQTTLRNTHTYPIVSHQSFSHEAAIVKLFLSKAIDAASLMKAKQDLIKALVALPAINLLPDKRLVVFAYRGRDFSYRTKSLADQIDMQFMVEIKTCAVNCGDLSPILCERALAVGGGVNIQPC
jgi:hypothetical protein